MKKVIITLGIVAVVAGSCGQRSNKRQNFTNDIFNESVPVPSTTDSTTQVLSKDTLISVSADWAILFLRYDERMKLWYEPYIVDLNKKDTIRIKNYNDENGSELDIRVSPNKRYAVMDNIIKGYVETENGEELHENYTCTIIDIINANSVMTMQEDCGGEWNNENQWIIGDEIIFNPK